MLPNKPGLLHLIRVELAYCLGGETYYQGTKPFSSFLFFLFYFAIIPENLFVFFFLNRDRKEVDSGGNECGEELEKKRMEKP